MLSLLHCSKISWGDPPSAKLGATSQSQAQETAMASFVTAYLP